MALNQAQLAHLAKLLSEADNTQIQGEVWHQLVMKYITVPIELFVIDDQGRVFLRYRKDREFDGHHHPGTVINDWETKKEALMRLVAGEIIRDAGLVGVITEPEPIGDFECPRDETSTRHAIALLYKCRFRGEYKSHPGMGFFPLDDLPEDTLYHHKRMLAALQQHLVDGKTIHVSA